MPITAYNINMNYLSVKDTAKKWGLSERSVRNYCQQGQIPNVQLIGKTWSIPDDAVKPARKVSAIIAKRTLQTVLQTERMQAVKNGIYHKIQIELTYNSNHIEGSQLTHDETRYIFETNTIGIEKKTINVDDIIETANHFRAIDFVIDNYNKVLSEKIIKDLHRILKSGTSDSRLSWFAVGEYKKLPNEVSGQETTKPEDVQQKIKELLQTYNDLEKKEFDTLLDFHVRFEKIHPFQDGNGRIGRLILFKECLKHNIVPFIITDELKMFYYRGLAEWENQRGYLRDTCLTAQDEMKKYLDYFGLSL